MPSNEDLYREMEREEEESVRHFKLKQRPDTPRPKICVSRDTDEAIASEIKEVISRIKRAEAGLPITRNPIFNLFLKATGQDKVFLPEAVDPNKGLLVQSGKSVEEVRQEILENPEGFKKLAKKAPEVKKVNAVMKTAQDLRGDR